MLGEEPELHVSDSLANVVENLACRVARSADGWVAPGQLLPYAPMSLGLIMRCLDDMVDGVDVLRDDRDGEIGFLLSAYEGPAEAGALDFGTCVSCDAALEGRSRVLCATCDAAAEGELRQLARKVGWPSQALHEHELFYLASQRDGLAQAEDLAGRSRATLRTVKRRLRDLTVQGYIRQDLDEATGAISYRFPPLKYGEPEYLRNRRRIEAYPASLDEELETKLVRICLMLGALLLALFAMAFMAVPYPVLLAVFLVAAPTIAIYVLRHRSPAAAD
jgi:hypothetical protein